MLPGRVRIVEVAARDGLQNEVIKVPVASRIALIEGLIAAGCKTIEAGSFVSRKWVPQMEGTEHVLVAFKDRRDISLPVLVPNEKGLESALAAGARDIAIFTAASETFCRKNINCSVAESLARYETIVERSRGLGIPARGYVSCVLGCPYEGEVKPADVARVARQLWEMGCTEISLGDTIGVGTPQQARNLVRMVREEVPLVAIAVHFHDTYGQALANIYACLEEGVGTVDASVAGLGGCPYAPGAAGNVATEDVVYMLNGMGVETGIDIDLLVKAGEGILTVLGKQSRSKAAQALAAKRNSVS